LKGYTSPPIVIIQRGGDDERHSNRVRFLSQPGTVSITTDTASNQASGTIVVGVNGSHHHSATATLQLSGTGSGTSVAMTTDSLRPSTLQIGDHTYRINPTSVLASTSSPTCTCEYLSFGLWASSVSDSRNRDKTYTAVGAYVAGTPTVNMPTMGSATYNGFMAGFASHNGHITTPTAGTYQNTWDFAARTGNLAITFDNRRYSGTAQATGGPGSTTFAGNFGSRGRSGSLSGGFFSSPNDSAAYQAGTFSIVGGYRSRYQATGVFAGQR
jgi:hypothetical protein